MNERAQELFRTACGLSAPLVLDCEGPEPSTSTPIALDLPFVLIGRHPRSDLVLEHPEVSRRHAILQAVADQLFVFDLHSRSKLFWDGDDVAREQGWLDDARSIKIGPYRIRRCSHTIDAKMHGDVAPILDPVAGNRPDAHSPPRAALELPIRMVNGPGQWPIVGWIALVGRAEPCQLVLTDDSISRFHAILIRTPMGVWVVDLLTREGVHVNGQRVRWAWIAQGDALQIGRFTFILRYETEPDQISRADVPIEAGADLSHFTGTELAVRPKVFGGGRALPPVPYRNRPRGGLQPTMPAPAYPAPGLSPSSMAPWQPSLVPAHAPVPMVLWQQQMQMMELFHNDMMFMMQMFIAMHGQHLASVRDEIAKVQQLTQELATLQGKLGNRSGSPEVERAGKGDQQARARMPGEPGQQKKRDGQPVSGDTQKNAGLQGPNSTPALGAPRAGKHDPRASKGASPPGPKRQAPADPSVVHERLTERIAELQRERQGYWQRILSALNN
jgi:pSer/pThr/pTyr-binding forkhead associated (FHA) protein